MADEAGPGSDGAEDEGDDGVMSAAQQAEAFAALARLRTAGLASPDNGRRAPRKLAPVAAALAVLRGEFNVVDDVTLSSEAKAPVAATTFGLSHPRKVLEYVALLGQLANRKPVQAVPVQAVAGGGAAAMAAAGPAAASPLATLSSAPEAGQQPQQHDGVEEEQHVAPTEEEGSPAGEMEEEGRPAGEEGRPPAPARVQGAAEASRASDAAARAVEVLAAMPAMPPTKVAKLLSARSPPTLARVVQPRLATAIPARAAEP